MTSAFGGQRSIQLSYGCLGAWMRRTGRGIADPPGRGNGFVSASPAANDFSSRGISGARRIGPKTLRTHVATADVLFVGKIVGSRVGDFAWRIPVLQDRREGVGRRGRRRAFSIKADMPVGRAREGPSPRQVPAQAASFTRASGHAKSSPVSTMRTCHAPAAVQPQGARPAVRPGSCAGRQKRRRNHFAAFSGIQKLAGPIRGRNPASCRR